MKKFLFAICLLSLLFLPSYPNPLWGGWMPPGWDEAEAGEVLDDVMLLDIYTRCVSTRSGLWLHRKPWESSERVLSNPLRYGTEVQIYPNPFGEGRWMEVWVPRYRRGGYLDSTWIGDCR